MSGRDLLARSGLLRPGRRVPSESTIRRIFQALDADELLLDGRGVAAGP